jgi:phosphatidylglycerophosphate synthase
MNRFTDLNLLISESVLDFLGRRDMQKTEFKDATRLQLSILAPLEKRCLIWLAERMPSWVNSDHLTMLGFIGMIMTGVCYWLARWNRFALLVACFWLAVNWFGDSLDGTLARVRNKLRPRYGFYVDHMVDTFGAFFLVGGMALSGYMSAMVALGVLIAYFMLNIEVYLATYAVGQFRLSYWKLGPTELRILICIGNLVLLNKPMVVFLGASYRLLDVAGVVSMAALGLTMTVSTIRNTRALYRAEPIS